MLANRADAPKAFLNTGRGFRPTSELTDVERQRILQDYEDDVLAKSAAASHLSSWKTWVFYHQRWFGAESSPLPVTVGSIKAIVSQLKDQKYTSIGNLISVAKDRHLDARFPWDEFLTREVRRATRSGTRGRGAAKQDDEIDIDAAFALDLGEEPLTLGGPANFGKVLEVGSFHILREIEISTALASAVSFNHDKAEESFCLPVSKTDPRAIGCSRSWGCVCDGHHNAPCAYHALKEQTEWLANTFPDVPFTELPLFPQINGNIVDKAAVVKSIEKVAELLGEPIKDQHGRNRFGGHTLRVAGSRRLARLAIPTATIMLLARWASTVILRYIRDAPLKALTFEYRARTYASGYSLKDAAELISPPKRKAIETDTVKYREHDDMLKAMTEKVSALEDKLTLPEFVRNAASGVHHRADPTELMESLGQDRITPCGWRYSTGNSQRLRSLPPFLLPKLLCNRCLRYERLKAAEADSGVSSDSVSSDVQDG